MSHSDVVPSSDRTRGRRDQLCVVRTPTAPRGCSFVCSRNVRVPEVITCILLSSCSEILQRGSHDATYKILCRLRTSYARGVVSKRAAGMTQEGIGRWSLQIDSKHTTMGTSRTRATTDRSGRLITPMCTKSCLAASAGSYHRSISSKAWNVAYIVSEAQALT